MATAKKTTKRKPKKQKADEMMDMGMNEKQSLSVKEHASKSKSPLRFIIIVAIIILLIIAVRYKQLFVVAMVNNNPITTWQLNQVMQQSYGKQTLDQIITETLLKNEAQKRNITVTQDEINQELQNVEASLGGFVTLDEALEQQGMTKKDLEDQVKLRIMVKKLVDDNVVVSDGEVEEYMEANKEYIQEGADPEQTRNDIRNYLKEQKVNEEIQSLIQELKNNANIVTFI